MSDELLKLPLHDKHVDAGATMGGEGGWEVPLSYGAALSEAAEVRRFAGVFDISHVGRIRIRDNEALELVERLCTADVVHQEDDTARYTLLLNETGGVLADAIVARLEGFWLITTDPCNRIKVLQHTQTVGQGMSVKVDDQTDKGAMLAVSGSAAREVLDAALPEKPGDLPSGGVKIGSLLVARYIVMRTSYTGMWGMEVILPKMFVAKAWRFITEKAGDNCLKPAGAAARDILRIEAGLCRYGHELNETIDPITSGLEYAVDFDHDFIGRAALQAIGDRGVSRRRVGLCLAQGRPGASLIPRLGMSVYNEDGLEVGTVTSGTFSPALQRAVAMAYVACDSAYPGTTLRVQVAQQSEPIAAEVMQLPFCGLGSERH